MEQSVRHQLLNFDIDRYLNPWIPHNRLYILPPWISRWLGYRSEPTKEPCAALQWPITILATIAGLCLVGGIGNYSAGVVDWHPPVMIASMGASAVLEFNTIRSPLSQPRNAVLGNTLAAVCGVAIAKLFQLNPDFHDIRWVSGAVGCALASWVMSLTNTIHPPGGATAVLASTDAAAIAMGWRFVPIVLLDTALLVAVACLFNNVLRQFPVYWWTGSEVGRNLRREREQSKRERFDQACAAEADVPKSGQTETSDTSSDHTLRREVSEQVEPLDGLGVVHVTAYKVQLPHDIELSEEELETLKKVQKKLRLCDGNPS